MGTEKTGPRQAHAIDHDGLESKCLLAVRTKRYAPMLNGHSFLVYIYAPRSVFCSCFCPVSIDRLIWVVAECRNKNQPPKLHANSLSGCCVCGHDPRTRIFVQAQKNTDLYLSCFLISPGKLPDHGSLSTAFVCVYACFGNLCNSFREIKQTPSQKTEKSKTTLTPANGNFTVYGSKCPRKKDLNRSSP